MANINAKLKTRAEATAVPVTQGNLFLFFDADNAGVLTVKDHNNVFTPIGGSSSSAGGETFFEFPAATGVIGTDIGKLMMNDGTISSPVAKVYDYAAAEGQSMNQWEIRISDFSLEPGNPNGTTNVYINGTPYVSTDWNSTPPATIQEEAGNFSTFLNTITNLNASAPVQDGSAYVITVTEDNFDNTKIEIWGWPPYDIIIQTAQGHPPLPAAPAGYPLGKLLGFTSGGKCKISNNLIEEYELDSGIDFSANDLYRIFDARFDMYKKGAGSADDITAVSQLHGYLPLIVVGAPGGKIRPFDFSLMGMDLLTESFDVNLLNAVYRHQIVGLALKGGNSGDRIPVIRWGALNVLFKPAVSTFEFAFGSSSK